MNWKCDADGLETCDGASCRLLCIRKSRKILFNMGEAMRRECVVGRLDCWGIAIRVELRRGRGRMEKIRGEGHNARRRLIHMYCGELGMDDYFLPPLYCFALLLMFFESTTCCILTSIQHAFVPCDVCCYVCPGTGLIKSSFK